MRPWAISDHALFGLDKHAPPPPITVVALAELNSSRAQRLNNGEEAYFFIGHIILCRRWHVLSRRFSFVLWEFIRFQRPTGPFC